LLVVSIALDLSSMSKRHRTDDIPASAASATKDSGDDTIHQQAEPRLADEAPQTKRVKSSEQPTVSILSALPWDADASLARVQLRCDQISWTADLTEELLSSEPLLAKLQFAANFVQEDAARADGSLINLSHRVEVSLRHTTILAASDDSCRLGRFEFVSMLMCLMLSSVVRIGQGFVAASVHRIL
jgi:hypothetical protein